MAGPWRGELRASASRRVTENNVGTCQGERGPARLTGHSGRAEQLGSPGGVFGAVLVNRCHLRGISKIAVTNTRRNRHSNLMSHPLAVF